MSKKAIIQPAVVIFDSFSSFVHTNHIFISFSSRCCHYWQIIRKEKLSTKSQKIKDQILNRDKCFQKIKASKFL